MDLEKFGQPGPMPAGGPPGGGPGGPGGPGGEPPEWMKEMMEKAEAEKAKRREKIDRFLPFEKVTADFTMKYRLFVPKAEGGKYPMVVFLHGIGECGDDNDAPLTGNNAAWDFVAAQDAGEDEPAFVLAPQSPLPIPNNIWEIPYLEAVGEIISELCGKYPVDESRIYITGLSLGGYGAWNLNRMLPNRFAAVVSCCPACLKGTMFDNYPDVEGLEACSKALINKPLWMFHAADDGAVPLEISRTMAETLTKAGRVEGKDFFLTIYPEEKHYGHGSWEAAFKEKDMHKWLFEQKL